MIEHKIYPNTYIDSVTLMSSTNRIKSELELNELIMLMGTTMNKEMIDAVGLGNDVVAATEPSDLIIALKHDHDEPRIDRVFELLTTSARPKQEETSKVFHRIEDVGDISNIAVISVPGIYAAYEAQQALEQGLHVMLFSDNVAVEDEIRLKVYAIEHDLLMMGPDCGTAILNGIGLCFANVVREGSIGLVAASGTGLQEVTALIDSFGGGITQAIGVGGRDLSAAVGGKMMLHAIDALAADPQTEIIALVSKPPAKDVEKRIIDRVKQLDKPVIVCFLDGAKTGTDGHITYVNRLADAALIAVRQSGIDVDFDGGLSEADITIAKNHHEQFAPSQQTVKGLFCGGTLTAEALSILRDHVPGITSNVAKHAEEQMTDPLTSAGSNLVDLGDDLFTSGRPHPMIEPSIRLDRILTEARNPETAVLLLDFELGFGSHEDPVGVTLDTLTEAQNIAKQDGRHLAIVAYVLGTEGDFQNRERAISRLHDIGAVVARTNAHASLLAASILKGGAL